jgi:prophage regulatory protein
MNQQPIYLLRRKQVEQVTSLSRSTIYRLIKKGGFPAPLQISKGAVRWRQTDVNEWQKSLVTTKGA